MALAMLTTEEEMLPDRPLDRLLSIRAAAKMYVASSYSTGQELDVF